MSNIENINKVLAHTCCAPCSSYAFEKLIEDGFQPVGFFYNPNIQPEEEYKKRRDELIWFFNLKNYNYKILEKNNDEWSKLIIGLEQEKEGGKRCEVCYKIRLEETAKHALENNYDAFTTVLTISPHKNTKIINKIGIELQNKYNIKFLEYDFKKNDGFKKSLELSKKYNLYRQNYCGCIISKLNKQS